MFESTSGLSNGVSVLIIIEALALQGLALDDHFTAFVQPETLMILSIRENF